jgi:FKBP-type peptidyl-prolyl cis-trans isomerase
VDLIVQGLRDGVGGGKVRLTDAEIIELLQDFQRQMYDKGMQKVAKVKKESEEYCAANAKKPGVKTTKSGLQYRVIKEGTGKIPKATDTVSVHYRGTLIDGTEFDSSYKRGKPAEFRVREVIPGWVEALQLMKEGSKWELTVPAALGYGDRPQQGGKIRPGDALIFEVELMLIKPHHSNYSRALGSDTTVRASLHASFDHRRPRADGICVPPRETYRSLLPRRQLPDDNFCLAFGADDWHSVR